VTIHTLPVRVDLVIFAIRKGVLQVLLWQRREPPHKGAWTLPGDFVSPGEPVEAAARRILKTKTGFEEQAYVEQLFTFCEPDLDPRGDLVSVAYYAVVCASGESWDGTFHAARKAPTLVFHHDKVLARGIDRLRTKTEYSTVPLRFLDETFTLSEVQQVYEVLLDRELDKRNFRRKMLALEAIEDTAGEKRTGAHRPARLFRLSSARPYLLKEKGILFPF
jgi:8-oxo-dGTP diphosphatase